jgi:hypothetical protein
MCDSMGTDRVTPLCLIVSLSKTSHPLEWEEQISNKAHFSSVARIFKRYWSLGIDSKE